MAQPCRSDDLEHELSRLEARFADVGALTDERERVIEELARVRQGLAHRADRRAPLRLPDLRIASPCKERWADMVGDDRVRVCNGCDRPVFDLSEMTLEQAEAVLATRGLTPCVRFYRRTDGTVMTADCPTGARRTSRKLAVVAGAVAVAGAGASPAMAGPPEPPPDPPPEVEVDDFEHDMGVPASDDDFGYEMMGIPVREDTYDISHRPTIEWSTWFRLGFGTEAHEADGVARVTTPVAAERRTAWEAALGADFSLPVASHGDLRLGGWAEVRTSSGPVVGGELLIDAAPGHLDMFQFDGQGILAFRAGGNGHVVTAAIAYGYLAPWKLFGPWNGSTRYMIGVRLVASATRSTDDPSDWSATAGLEVEPIGALRYLLGIRSWY